MTNTKGTCGCADLCRDRQLASDEVGLECRAVYGRSAVGEMHPARTTAFIKGDTWTHKTKGGHYICEGLSVGAGISRAEQRVIYRCRKSGILYHRTTYDFVAQMERIA